MKTTRKPSGYWNNFANVEKELRAFIAREGTPGVMPTRNQLFASGRYDLPVAIAKHGGFTKVMKRLGLKRAEIPRRESYWSNFTHVEKELRAFIAQHGTPGIMPTLPDLREARQFGLLRAIEKRGGLAVVAKELGLGHRHNRRPRHYWTNFANVKRELRAHIAEHGTRGVMPTYLELSAAGHRRLGDAIRKHGGSRAVARRLGLKHRRTLKSMGH